MKHLFKKIKIDKTIYLGILFIFCLISCNAPENLIDEANYNNTIKIDNVEVKELFKRKEFNDIVTKLYKPKNGNEVSRTVMENEYGFTILDQPAKVIEQNNKITYTLAISRDNQLTPSTSFENLIISNDSLNQPQAVIVKYRPFVPMNQLLTNNGGFEGEVKVTPITYNNTQATGKISYSCFNILLSKCKGIPYDCGGSFCGYYHYTICVADDETGGGGDNGTIVGSGSTAGSGNPNGGGSNPITTPNGGSTSTASNPCATLNKINTINHTAYVSNNDIATNPNACDNCENGYIFRMADNQNPLQPVQLQTSINSEIGIPVGPTIYGANHTHPSSAYQMFSFHDMNTLLSIYLNAHDNIKKHAVFMLNNSDGTNYAILIDNFETFANFINEQLTNTGINDCENALDEMEDILESKYKRSNNLEKTFLNFISSAGISLYSPTDANFSNWQKLSLPDIPSKPVVKTPCN